MDVSEGVNFLLSSISLQVTSGSGTPFLSWLLSRLTSNKPGTACLRQRKRDRDSDTSGCIPMSTTIRKLIRVRFIRALRSIRGFMSRS